MANFGRNIPTEIYGPPPEVIPNIPVRRNQNGPFHLKSDRNFRNLWHNKKHPEFFRAGRICRTKWVQVQDWTLRLHSDFLLTKRFEPLRMIARWSLFMGKLLKVRNAAEGKKDVRSVDTEQKCSHTKLSIVNDSNRLVYLTFGLQRSVTDSAALIKFSVLSKYGLNSRSYIISTP